MTTLSKIIVATLMSLSLFSCNFDLNLNPGVRGNGNVVTEERNINEPFSTIKATEGLHVNLTQGDNEFITVEADENLQGLIITEVKDGVLKIHTRENIGRATAKNVTVNFREVSEIISTSGSDVYSTNVISADHLNIKTSSGSNMKLELRANNVNCNSSSGSSLKLYGKTQDFSADASSGSNIKAGELMAISSEVKASSGANVTVNTTKELTANASSGANINYFGNPEKVKKNNSSSGSINNR